ncbi:hypothetical protein N0V90_005373 [Kalmusia sp. IMI 367209]|nr:hypothetical protein N0V90_005373 [Kalmusia sp. IMI 367209]
MSDADYEAFLNKANEDTGGAEATAQTKKYGTKSVNTAVPRELESVTETYTSEADEPFEAVALKYEHGSLSSRHLKELLGHDEEVEELSVKKWDPRGQYESVVETVKKVVGGDDGKVLGLKALSVES